ncbi:hypothetical protein KY336_03085 [Candidatus Woesearchaeota archaeon]|nr:hypothetical protein [Candidatus Woesearchaeota archaeon]
MGFFDWLKGLFGGKLPEEAVNVDELEAWFRKKTQHKLKDKDMQIDRLYKQFDLIIKEMGDVIGVLETAELTNPNIPARMKNFMIGNRNNYVKQVRLFVDQIPDFGPNFNTQFQKILNDFGKRTAKNYTILQEFFADQTKAIAAKIKDLDDVSKKISGTATSNEILEIENCLKTISQIQEKREEHTEIAKMVEKNRAEIEKLKQMIVKGAESRKNRLESKQYKELMRLKDLIVKTKKEVQILESQINELFAPLFRMFRKYKKITIAHEKLLDKYLKDPVDAFMKDTRFDIVTAVTALGKHIEKGSMQMDAKEKRKILDKISLITKEKLRTILKRYKELKKIGKAAEYDVGKIKVVQELEKIDLELDRMQNRKRKLEGEIEDGLKMQGEWKVDEEKLRNKLVQNIKKLLKINLTIK